MRLMINRMEKNLHKKCSGKIEANYDVNYGNQIAVKAENEVCETEKKYVCREEKLSVEQVFLYFIMLFRKNSDSGKYFSVFPKALEEKLKVFINFTTDKKLANLCDMNFKNFYAMKAKKFS